MTSTLDQPAVAYQRVEACLGCDATDLRAVLDLGALPLANNLVPPEAPADAAAPVPLGIQLCGTCSLVQLTHVVNPEHMFSTYRYVPSTSTTWLRHCEELAAAVADAAALRPGDFVVEVGSNDGSLLRCFQRRGLQVLGVDPAANIAADANASGVPTLNRFFGREAAAHILSQHPRPRAIVSTNVLAHVPAPRDLLAGVAMLLADDGLYVNESPSLRELITHNEFDTIYHEHVSYLSLAAVAGLFERTGLRLVDAEPQAIHGGTLRACAVRSSSSARQPAPHLAAMMRAEAEAGVADLRTLHAFAKRATTVRDSLRALVRDLRASGKRVAAYGATAKGNTLLGFSGLTAADIDYIVDRNPLKHGMSAPGSRIPIVPVAALEADPPDVLLLLAWNLADEISQQLAWFSQSGKRFLIPVPTPTLR
jgi:novobiocin biosynthesis protein NovU/D-mycarose 3-C-methyltransferase